MMAPPCDLTAPPGGVSAAWHSRDVACVNGNTVRIRLMQDRIADWHVHRDSDELFYVIDGTVVMDTEHGVHAIGAGQLFVVPVGTRHRARVAGRATMLVIDAIAPARTDRATCGPDRSPDRPTR
jgi:mannose-6-phosphate isomerase-like protein (cupin superfamily)